MSQERNSQAQPAESFRIRTQRQAQEALRNANRIARNKANLLLVALALAGCSGASNTSPTSDNRTTIPVPTLLPKEDSESPQTDFGAQALEVNNTDDSAYTESDVFENPDILSTIDPFNPGVPRRELALNTLTVGYAAGNVAVNLLFLQCSGQGCTEQWNTQTMSAAINTITGSNQLLEDQVNSRYPANLDITILPPKTINVSREPINGPAGGVCGLVTEGLGQSVNGADCFQKIKTLNRNAIDDPNTDYDQAYTIVAVNSNNKPVDNFSDGKLMYAYKYSHFVFIGDSSTNSNRGLHETNHIFGSDDLYENAKTPCNSKSGALNKEAQNSQYHPGLPKCNLDEPSNMRSTIFSILDPATNEQIGLVMTNSQLEIAGKLSNFVTKIPNSDGTFTIVVDLTRTPSDMMVQGFPFFNTIKGAHLSQGGRQYQAEVADGVFDEFDERAIFRNVPTDKGTVIVDGKIGVDERIIIGQEAPSTPVTYKDYLPLIAGPKPTFAQQKFAFEVLGQLGLTGTFRVIDENGKTVELVVSKDGVNEVYKEYLPGVVGVTLANGEKSYQFLPEIDVSPR
jgi:hypothetical protein